MPLINSTPYQNTYVAPVRPDGHYAYLDLDESGDFNPDTDRRLATRTEGGAGAISYAKLLAVVEQGTTRGAEVASALDFKHRPSAISFFRMPPGLNHPVVDFVFFKDEEQQLWAAFAVQKRAELTPDGVDHDGDGAAESRLFFQLARDHTLQDEMVLLGYVRDRTFIDAPPAPGEPRFLEEPPLGQSVGGRNVTRTVRQNEDGSQYLEYGLTDEPESMTRMFEEMQRK